METVEPQTVSAGLLEATPFQIDKPMRGNRWVEKAAICRAVSGQARVIVRPAARVAADWAIDQRDPIARALARVIGRREQTEAVLELVLQLVLEVGIASGARICRAEQARAAAAQWEADPAVIADRAHVPAAAADPPVWTAARAAAAAGEREAGAADGDRRV